MRGPRQTNTDISAFKNFEIGEEKFVQFRSDFFNAFNHVILGQPSNGFGGSAFGHINSYGPARSIQMSLKVIF
jgi:hypothetical protein